MNIKQWAEEDRPREKMLARGKKALSEAELLAIVLGSGNTEETAVELARRILSENKNNLHEVARMSIQEFCKRFKGIGPAKAITILAALELGERRNLTTELERPCLRTSKDVYQLFNPMLRDLPHEEMWIALLNHANKVIDLHRVSQGGITGTVVDVQVIMRHALDKYATQIILSHNHPSGNNFPSDGDKKVTRQVRDAAALFNIQLLDHLIVARDKYFSFADEGML